MDTVVDIEPASFALTPGRAETVTLTVHNHGEDVEAYHLSAAGDAADQVVIEPETLLVRPGESGTAVATIAIPAEARWPVGHLLLRFEIAPAVQPDDRVAVEAIASVRPFSGVDAALSSPDLDGRRGDATDILIANSGNAHVYAGLAVSAGELAVVMDRRRVTVPAGSTDSVELGLRVRKLLWRGEPVEHPFAVTVVPETAPAVRVEGTFTQLPVFSPRGFTAALAVAGALVVLIVVWLAALAWNALSPDGGSPSQTTAAETSAAAPVNVAVELAAGDLSQAGDAAVATLSAEVANAPDGALVAIAVQWPAELALSESTCESWVGPEIDRELQGPPRSGDECLIDPSGGGGAELTFATPPAGFSGQVDATATRLLTLADGEVQALETAEGSSFGQAALPIELRPYPFWLDLAITEPSDSDEGERQATIGVHRTLSGDGSDESARMAFELLLPGFAELDFLDGCDALGDNDATCVVFFGADLDFWEVTATFETDLDSSQAGLVSVQGVELSVNDVDVPPAQIGEQIRGAEQLLIAGDLFPVDVELDSEEAEAGETVTATVEITHTPLPSDVETLRTGSWALGVELTWPEALILKGAPRGCVSFDRGICELPGPAESGRAVITIQFTVADAFDSGDVAANGARLLYDPTTEADERDDREQPPVELPAEWIGSDTVEFFPS